MTSVEFEKDLLRREIRQGRNALSLEWRQTTSHRITGRLWSFSELDAVGAVHCYVGWRSEVATTELIRKLLKTGKKVAIPLVDIRHHVLKHFYTHDLDLLKKGAFGIPEPDPSLCEQARIADLPFIVVPGVAFDRSGNRLGSGHGYYDRFLAQSSGLRVGLAFGMQIIDDVPAANYDQKMDFVVTEDEIIPCATRQKAG